MCNCSQGTQVRDPPIGIVQKVFSPKGVPRIFDAFLTGEAAVKLPRPSATRAAQSMYTELYKILYTVRPRGTQIDPRTGTAWQSALGSSKNEAESAWLSAGRAGRLV